MIYDLLPDGVAAYEAFTDPPDAMLFPEEHATLERAVTKRRREFTTVRMLARQALVELGVPVTPILPGLRGAPGWPVGVVGSMTHCDGYRASAVARRSALVTVGIDAEPHAPLPDGVHDLVARPEEQQLLQQLAGEAPTVAWDRLLFSAKESVYKAWFPLTRRWLDFSEASVQICTDAATDRGSFTAQLLVSGPVVAGRTLSGFTGRWMVRHGLVLTAIAVSAHETPPPTTRNRGSR